MADSEQEQEKAGRPPALGLYVHVPFCASKCDFCAFYQTAPTGDLVRRYLAAVDQEAGLVAWRAPVETVFWGGGTPGLLSPRAIGELGGVVRRHAGEGVREWSVEMAPSSVTPQRLAALREIGVTRISLGAQSFQPALLEALGRQHTREHVWRAYDLVRNAGFVSVNLDLMFALPGQDTAAWEADLAEAVRLAPDHISTYCLTFEEDTALYVKLSQGKVKPDIEKEALFYADAWASLAAAGYAQYEISNFARPGAECLHNLNTWRMQEWVGLGPSASSQYAGWRGTNIPDLEKWMGDVADDRRATTERIELTPRNMAEDALIFGLRMNEGVPLGELEKRFPDAPWRGLEVLWERLAAEGLMEFSASENARLTLRGRLVADAVGGEVMEVFAETQNTVHP